MILFFTGDYQRVAALDLLVLHGLKYASRAFAGQGKYYLEHIVAQCCYAGGRLNVRIREDR
jgi:hypothetical protein